MRLINARLAFLDCTVAPMIVETTKGPEATPGVELGFKLQMPDEQVNQAQWVKSGAFTMWPVIIHDTNIRDFLDAKIHQYVM